MEDRHQPVAASPDARTDFRGRTNLCKACGFPRLVMNKGLRFLFGYYDITQPGNRTESSEFQIRSDLSPPVENPWQNYPSEVFSFYRSSASLVQFIKDLRLEKPELPESVNTISSHPGFCYDMMKPMPNPNSLKGRHLGAHS